MTGRGHCIEPFDPRIVIKRKRNTINQLALTADALSSSYAYFSAIVRFQLGTPSSWALARLTDVNVMIVARATRRRLGWPHIDV